MAVNIVDGMTFGAAVVCPVFAGVAATAAGAGWLTLPCVVAGSPVGFAVLYVGRKLAYSITGVLFRILQPMRPWAQQLFVAPLFFFFVILPLAAAIPAVFAASYATIFLAAQATHLGGWVGFAATSFSAFISVAATVAFCKWRVRVAEHDQDELIEKYPLVYRVIALPTDTRPVVKAEGAEIEVGDYGWQAEPLRSDGLTYLHGLTKEWGVAWYTGFQEDQIERVGLKPRSQYDFHFAWIEDHPCPYPIQSSRTINYPYDPMMTRVYVRGRFWC